MTATRRTMVPRRRLLDRLGDRYRSVVTIIEAGAGFGKTTLIRQAIDESADLDRGTDVVAQAGIGTNVVESLAATLEAADGSVQAVADAVLTRSPDDVVLWIDDTHRLDDEESLAIDELLHALPSTGHLVLSGRRIPRLTVRRFELDGLVLRLGEDDLRFDSDERDVFGQLRHAEVPIRADGWPALMELETTAGRSGSLDYLADEVIADLDDVRRQALVGIAHLDWFDGEMVRATSDFEGTLDDLIAGLPLARISTRLDPSGQPIRVAILHDLLRDALVELGGDHHDLAVVATAEEMLRRGEVVAAARRFASIDDTEGLERVAQRLIDDLHAASSLGDRREAVEIVSAALGDDDPQAAMLRGVHLAIADPIAAAPALRQALDAAIEVGRSDLEIVGEYRLSEMAYLRGDVASVALHSDRLAELAESGDPVARRLAFLPRVWLARMTGRTDEAIALLDQRLATGDDDAEMHAVARFYRTITLAYIGRVRESLRDVERYADALPPGLFSDRLGGFVTIQQWMLGEQTAEVRSQAERLVDQIEARGQVHLFVEGAATCAIFAANAGDLDAARELVARAAKASRSLTTTAWSVHTLAQAQAVLDVFDRGDDAAAARLENAIPAGGPSDGLSAHVYNLTAGLSYLLVPRVRDHWEQSDVEPDLALRTEVPRALVAFRELDDTAPAALLPWADVHRIKPWALEPHLVELAVAAIAGGSDDAVVAFADLRDDQLRVLEPLSTSSEPTVARAAGRILRTTPRRPDGTLSIGVLGPLVVDRRGRDETDLPVWRRARAKDLLMVLIHERKVSRVRLAELLWPDKGAVAAQNNLRVNLSHLMNALDPDRDGSIPSWVVRSEGESIRLDDSGFVQLDVDRFRTARADALLADGSSPREALDLHLSAVETFRGDYLDGYELVESMYYEQLHLRGEFVSSAIRAADLLLATGVPDEAERIVRRASQIEPLNEPAQRALSAALLAQRRVGAAIELLTGLLRRLADLEIPPEPATRRLAARLRIHSGS